MGNRDAIPKAARAEDLARSGLSKPAVMRKLGLDSVLSVAETRELTGVAEPAVSYEIPYFGLDGERLKHSRWKVISTRDDIPLRYYQKPNTVPRIYMPPLVDWEGVAIDVTRRIVITEGEKKAACACLHGLPCVGLGGVWNWKAKRWAMGEVKDFDLFEWRGREVEICYDADLSNNENVAKALAALCGMLSKRGAAVFVRYLDSSVTGDLPALDDFMEARGVDAYLDLECPEADFSRELRRFNDQLTYVVEMNGYYSLADRVFYRSPKTLAQRYGSVKVIGESGRPISAIGEWVQWPHMRTVQRLTYEPDRPEVTDRCLNEWRGWGAECRRGEVGQFLEVVRSVEDWEWLLQWLAYPIQRPGTKLYTAALLWSPNTGTGKTFVGNTMQDIYGTANTATITSDNLHDARLSWIKNKQFILGEEVSSSNRRSDSGVLKHVITGDVVRVDEKYVPAYELPNRANFLFTSNHPDAVRIEKGDRRFWVGRLDEERPQRFWNRLNDWRANGGASALRYHLEHRVSLEGFDPTARAPETYEKSEMVYTSMSALEQWVEDLVECEDSFFTDVAEGVAGRDTFEVSALIKFMPEELTRMNPSPTAVGRALARAGAVSGGVVNVGGKSKRLVAVRNLAYWESHKRDPHLWAANSAGKLVVKDSKLHRKRKV